MIGGPGAGAAAAAAKRPKADGRRRSSGEVGSRCARSCNRPRPCCLWLFLRRMLSDLLGLQTCQSRLCTSVSQCVLLLTGTLCSVQSQAHLQPSVGPKSAEARADRAVHVAHIDEPSAARQAVLASPGARHRPNAASILGRPGAPGRALPGARAHPGCACGLLPCWPTCTNLGVGPPQFAWLVLDARVESSRLES